jgi:hypothetical protein
MLNKRITGSRVMFLECFNPSTNETCRPRAWGVKVDREYKDSLLQKKWHTDECETDLLLGYLLLGSRLDVAIGKLAGISTHHPLKCARE